MNKKHITQSMCLMVSILFIFFAGQAGAQFMDEFDGPAIDNGWVTEQGSGIVTIQLSQGDGYAMVDIDATQDKLNVWYALIKHTVSDQMDLNLLEDEKYELRVETRVRSSRAPRRINMRLQTQRTHDYHANLMEFDIADTTNWYTFSMTTHNFDGKAGDNVQITLALIDWGLRTYQLDVDYMKVDIVHVDSVGVDLGNPIPYHPPVPELDTFSEHIPVLRDGMIDSEFTTRKFNDWSANDASGEEIRLLKVGGTQYVIMQWDLSAYAGRYVSEAGLLELTTFNAERASNYSSDFGLVRVVETIGGDEIWNQTGVTYDQFCEGAPLHEVLNEQMIIDFMAAANRDSSNLLTIPNVVLQRLIDGKTLGIALRPLGAVHASFYAMENEGIHSAKLHFNIDSTSTALNPNPLLKLPDQYCLDQNYPNPFNPETTMRYQIIKPSKVVITIYNMNGQKVKTLVDRFQQPGEYTLIWDGKDELNRIVSSGIYLFKMQAGEFKMQRKMTLLR